MKILNGYANIGGNRWLWGDVDVTAIEINPKRAAMYQKLFPKDHVIIEDAHEFLRQNHREFDFIWMSPPCPTHGRIRKYTNGGRFEEVYPDCTLWQEIIFLRHYCSCKWVVENVISYYEPFLKPQEIGRHYFWSNFNILPKKMQPDIRNTEHMHIPTDKMRYFPKNLPRQMYRDAVHPELGLHILKCAINRGQTQLSLNLPSAPLQEI